jgi:hypothetical protein
MNNLDVILEKAKAKVRARGYNWEEFLTLSRMMKIAIEAGLFDTFNARVKIRDQKRAVEAFVAGKKIGEWDSIKSAALAMNVHKSCISACVAEKTYSAGKYNGSPIKWRYKK